MGTSPDYALRQGVLGGQSDGPAPFLKALSRGKMVVFGHMRRTTVKRNNLFGGDAGAPYGEALSPTALSSFGTLVGTEFFLRTMMELPNLDKACLFWST